MTGEPSGRARWIALGVLVVFELLLFRSYAAREVIPYYPRHYDQTYYLETTYRIIERLRVEGNRSKLIRDVARETTPLGPLLPCQAAATALLTTSPRWAALLVNFSYLAVLLATLVAVAPRLLGSPAGAWTAILIGLTLCLRTPFMAWGGMDDFRLDFAACCLFGSFIALAGASGGFRDRRLALAAGAVASVLVLARFIATVYVAGFFGLLALGLVLRRGPDDRARLGNLLAASAIPLVIALVWGSLKRKVLFGYYVVGHVTGAEKDIRAAEAGLQSVFHHLTYYPSWIWQHLGHTWAGAALVLLLAALAWRLSAARPEARQAPAPVLEPLLAIAVPLAVLTINQAKSPVVGGILVVPCTLLLVAIAHRIARGFQGAPAWLTGGLAALVLAAGLGHHVGSTGMRSMPPALRADASRSVELTAAIARRAEAAGLGGPRLAMARNLDFLTRYGVVVVHYEHTGRLLRPAQTLGGTIFDVTPEAVRAGISAADFAVLVLDPDAPDEPSAFPFDRRLREMDREVRSRVDEDFDFVGGYWIRGTEYGLFAREQASVVSPLPLDLVLDRLELSVDGRWRQPGDWILIRGEIAPRPGERLPLATATDVTLTVLDRTLLPIGEPRRARLETRGRTYLLAAEFPDLGPAAEYRLRFDIPASVALASAAGGEEPRNFELRAPLRCRPLTPATHCRDSVALGSDPDVRFGSPIQRVPLRLPAVAAPGLKVWVETSAPAPAGERGPRRMRLTGPAGPIDVDLAPVPDAGTILAASIAWPAGAAPGAVVWLDLDSSGSDAPAVETWIIGAGIDGA